MDEQPLGTGPEVTETRLPGVGIRHDFTTARGDRIGVISHRSGRRDLVIYDANDPDAARVLTLNRSEAQAVAELMGTSPVLAHIASELQQNVEGMAIDWVPVPDGSPVIGNALGETRIRTRTGVLVVAVIRAEDTIPAPGPDFVFSRGDTAVVVGPPPGIEQLGVLLQTG